MGGCLGFMVSLKFLIQLSKEAFRVLDLLIQCRHLCQMVGDRSRCCIKRTQKMGELDDVRLFLGVVPVASSTHQHDFVRPGPV